MELRSPIHVDVLPFLESFAAEVAEFQERAGGEGRGRGRRGDGRRSGGKRKVSKDGGFAEDLGVFWVVLLGFQNNDQTCHLTQSSSSFSSSERAREETRWWSF